MKWNDWMTMWYQSVLWWASYFSHLDYLTEISPNIPSTVTRWDTSMWYVSFSLVMINILNCKYHENLQLSELIFAEHWLFLNGVQFNRRMNVCLHNSYLQTYFSFGHFVSVCTKVKYYFQQCITLNLSIIPLISSYNFWISGSTLGMMLGFYFVTKKCTKKNAYLFFFSFFS